MRRPASNSCLLLPKPSEEELLEDEGSTSATPLSVTLIHQCTLPTYSSERFFLLSELQVHAPSILFLSDIGDRDEDQSTQATEDETVDDSNSLPPNPTLNVPLPSTSGGTIENHTPPPLQQLPPFVILYILWKPEMTTHPETFTELYILDALHRMDLERNRANDADQNKEADDAPKEIYLVIDRVLPAAVGMTLDEDGPKVPATDASEDVDTTLALEYALIKYIAAHAALRTRIQGVVLGQSNHVRAAPGLERCTHAVTTVGTAERRRWAASQPGGDASSGMGLVTRSSEDLLGLQDEGVTDAIEGVTQRIVTGEWLGQGDIYMFAARAHMLWKQKRGLANDGGEDGTFGLIGEKRSIPRRKSRAPIAMSNSLYNSQRQRGFWKEIPDTVYEKMGYLLIGLYIYFHYGRRDDDVLVVSLFRPVLQGCFFLIRSWNQVIQSARGW